MISGARKMAATTLNGNKIIVHTPSRADEAGTVCIAGPK
jgi:hypothetical protein